MLMAHPAILSDLVKEYETLRTLNAQNAVSTEVRRRIEDVTYTLCVSTGTRDADSALAVARKQLAARRQDDVALEA
ncbi:DUF5133 domain-containing protein [Streptomyces solincola]|uniref:DUF5133 domain-containing protein n=1 Tax=Streptomyces solincola TaxID=2100817 RepID=A0A2S9PR63_9ACTN|nr:DUF5133 domain-containing protein [Streptomyces solincola]PRH76883.1 DUF5133 domain-containing protein [Streptomyces solincola]